MEDYAKMYAVLCGAIDDVIDGGSIVVAVLNAVADNFHSFLVCSVSSLSHIDITPSTSAGS